MQKVWKIIITCVLFISLMIMMAMNQTHSLEVTNELVMDQMNVEVSHG